MTFKKIFVIIIMFPNIIFANIEQRIFIFNLEDSKNLLIKNGAVYKSKYFFTESIYKAYKRNHEYYRVRHFNYTEWNQKEFTVTYKKAFSSYSKAKTLKHSEFDTIQEVKNFIDKSFKFKFSFKRKGFEYQLGDSFIYLEDIEHLNPTVEIVAKSEKDLLNILNILKIKNPKYMYKSVPLFIEKIL